MLSPSSFAEIGSELFDFADTGRESALTPLLSLGTFAELGRDDLAEFGDDLFGDAGLVVFKLGDFIETCESSVAGFEAGSSGDFDGSRSTVRAEAGLEPWPSGL